MQNMKWTAVLLVVALFAICFVACGERVQTVTTAANDAAAVETAAATETEAATEEKTDDVTLAASEFEVAESAFESVENTTKITPAVSQPETSAPVDTTVKETTAAVTSAAEPVLAMPEGDIVVDAVSYTKDVIDCFSGGHYDGVERFSRHTIKIPKLTLDSDAAKQFNQKIYKTFNDTVDVLKAGTEKNDIYMIGYEYSVKNGIVGILVTDETFLQYSGAYIPVYEFYYYDVLHDKELTMMEYLAALGVEYADVVKAFNAGWSTDPADKSLIGVVLFPDKTAVLRDGIYGLNMETGETALAVIDKSMI